MNKLSINTEESESLFDYDEDELVVGMISEVRSFSTLPTLCISGIEIKINLNCGFNTSLWCCKRFYESLRSVGKKCRKTSFNLIFSLRPGIGTGRVNSSWDYSFSANANFSERLSFLTPSVSGVKRCWFFVKFCVSTKWMIFLLFKSLKCQGCPHIETSQ